MLTVVVIIGAARSFRNEPLRSRIFAMAACLNDPFRCLPWLWRRAVTMEGPLRVISTSSGCPSSSVAVFCDVATESFDLKKERLPRIPPDLVFLWDLLPPSRLLSAFRGFNCVVWGGSDDIESFNKLSNLYTLKRTSKQPHPTVFMSWFDASDTRVFQMHQDSGA